jgi:hypothetical protein
MTATRTGTAASTVTASHPIAGQVRRQLREDIPWVPDVLVHIEPAHAPQVEPPPASAGEGAPTT